MVIGGAWTLYSKRKTKRNVFQHQIETCREINIFFLRENILFIKMWKYKEGTPILIQHQLNLKAIFSWLDGRMICVSSTPNVKVGGTSTIRFAVNDISLYCMNNIKRVSFSNNVMEADIRRKIESQMHTICFCNIGIGKRQDLPSCCCQNKSIYIPYKCTNSLLIIGCTCCINIDGTTI